MKWLPRTLGGQLAILLIAALLVAQVVGLLIFIGDRADAVRSASRSGLLESMGSVMRMLAQVPPEERAELAKSASTPRIRYWISEDGAVEPRSRPPPRPDDSGGGPFSRIFNMPMREPPRIAILDNEGQRLSPPWREDRRGPRGRYFLDGERYDVLASVPFEDVGWFNAQTGIRSEPVSIPWPSIITTIVAAAAILIIVAFMARRVTRPLGVLADSVEAFGRGSASKPIPEAGPSEVRRLTSAFNLMQERLERFISDRTRMIAAIGHDLRTPITSLKLRAELLDDEEARTRMLATLDDMQNMAEAALAFARDDAASEAARSVDLNALVESLVDDLNAIGKDVTFVPGDRLPYVCRPTALKRAIANVVENAVRYGVRARITLARGKSGPASPRVHGGAGPSGS